MKVIVIGPRGKMGKLITQVAASRDDMELVGAIAPKGRDYIGKDLGTVAMTGFELGVPVTDDLENIIDSCEIMAHALGKELSDIAVYGREGESPREPGTIGYHSLRAGNIPSSHTVYFGGMGERLEITHHSYNWECFARGACDCAAYLEGKGPGFYSIKDVLGI